MTENAPVSSVAKVLREALIDEYKAIAVYQEVMDAFGPVRPFVNIIEAERTHVQALLPLFERYGVPVPEDTSTTPAEAPSSILEACRNAVEARSKRRHVRPIAERHAGAGCSCGFRSPSGGVSGSSPTRV